MKITIINQKFSTCGNYSVHLEHHSNGVYEHCFEVVIYHNQEQVGHNAFHSYQEALDFFYSTIKAHGREGILYK